jgi:hypothetical protein
LCLLPCAQALAEGETALLAEISILLPPRFLPFKGSYNGSSPVTTILKCTKADGMRHGLADQIKCTHEYITNRVVEN